MKKSVNISAKIEDTVYSELERIAKEKEWSISHVIRKILEEYCEQNKT